MAFITMLAAGPSNIATAIEYARDNLKPYIGQHQAGTDDVVVV